MRFRHGSKLIAGVFCGVIGCGSDADDPFPGTMGLNGTGGATGTGGASVPPPGGTGGYKPTPTGGQGPGPTGGTTSSTGGQVGSTGGQQTSTGGVTGSGGETGTTGGATSTGGATATGGSVGTGGGGPGPGGECLKDTGDYFKAGPFKVAQKTVGAVKFWAPDVPAGCKVPVVHLANGTGATCGTYAASLTRLATHGFLACCYENANTGAGTQGIEAIDTALKTYPDIADMRFGSTGHSQGGQASFIVMALAEKKWGDKAIYAGLAMQPASGFGTQPAGGTWQQHYATIKGPFFMFSGQGSDGLVSQSWVQSAFNALADTTEAYFWAKQGGTHIPVPNGEEMQISIPWFRWKLLGDGKACAAFKNIPTSDKTWQVVKVQAEKQCQ